MMKINEGDRVGVIENGQLIKGIVKNVYPELNSAVVKFDFGDVEKVALTNLAVLPEETVQEQKKPVEKSEITITPDEFRGISCTVIAKRTKSNLMLGLLVGNIVADIHKALFFEGDND